MTRSIARADRELARDELGRGTYDVLVIGGGILGISITWMAAQAGLRVALVDAGDFAGATSSASSKLVHGGLRYLQTGNVALVAENHRERRALSRTIAPHLVRPLPFLVPVYADGPHHAAKLGAGVFLYSALSGFADGVGGFVKKAEAQNRVPALRGGGLRAVATYGDHQMNDSRVAITTLRAAVGAGAVVLNHASVTGLLTSRGTVVGAALRDGRAGDEFEVSARLVVNAAGPWVDHIRRMADPGCAPSIRLSKGAHLVMRRHDAWQAALTIPIDRHRVSFAIPWEDHLLLGTTDEQYDGDPGAVSATETDIAQILDEASRAVEAEQLRRNDITYTFAGLRVLPAGDGGTAKAKRETVITEEPSGMLSVAGGKWTTYRHIGHRVLHTISSLRGGFDVSAAPAMVPLPGVAGPDAVTRRLLADLDDKVAAHLATHYGALAFDIARLVRDAPELGERIHQDGPDIWAQVAYARDNEWACTADDVLRRRTTVTIRGLVTDEISTRVSAMLEA
jgi:glycerol-3-phosphate dehydrogenase